MIDPVAVFASFPAGRVLDVATGRGGFIQHLLGSLRNLQEIVGVDQGDMSEIFTQTFAGKPVRFMQMDAQALDFPDASFDTVCIANSLHHLADPAGALGEMLRVLKPGGRLALWEMFCDGQSETQQTHVELHHWWAAVDTACGVRHNRTYTQAELAAFVQPLGLTDLLSDVFADLSEDPHAPETAAQLQAVIDQYLERIAGLPQQAELSARGLALRQRVTEVGFHGASALLALGVKA